ncbi:cytosine permease, partial [Streptomyces sp. NPDC006324]|uniref:cytosine permease n=1 Tax=Streptomyces sp. NPDC006324 TaxID=3156751 RepID=UPI0033B3040B
MASTFPDQNPAPRAAQVTPPAADRPGRVEAHGIDHIPDEERHGHPRELFPVWAAANVNYLSLVIGGALVLMGLSLWQALGVIVAGNLFWVLTGLLDISAGGRVLRIERLRLASGEPMAIET